MDNNSRIVLAKKALAHAERFDQLDEPDLADMATRIAKECLAMVFDRNS